MPYIEKKKRVPLAPHTEVYADTPGELSYQITKLCDWYLGRQDDLSFAGISQVIGVIETVKAEIISRIYNPYEELKRKENGDVYSKENLVGHEPKT